MGFIREAEASRSLRKSEVELFISLTAPRGAVFSFSAECLLPAIIAQGATHGMIQKQ
jgi:hypothetical protein